MSSSFKKLLPIIILVIIFAGGYLVSELTGGFSSIPVRDASIAVRAQEIQSRLNYLSTISGFLATVRDERIIKLIPITSQPNTEPLGRDNPFIR